MLESGNRREPRNGGESERGEGYGFFSFVVPDLGALPNQTPDRLRRILVEAATVASGRIGLRGPR